MNIFIFHENVKLNARMHCNAHLVKMITEHVQMMTTVVAETNPEEFYELPEEHRFKPLSKGHRNHPCTKWLFESLDNYQYLETLTYELHEEWKMRFDHPEHKIHRSYEKMCFLPSPNIASKGRTPFAQAMPDEYKEENVVLAYRNYFNGEKQAIAEWKPRWMKRTT